MLPGHSLTIESPQNMLAFLTLMAGGLFGFSCGTELPLVPVNIGTNELTVEVASTPETRACGLSQRDTLDADRGMLFVFPFDTSNGFWMKDTLIPLEIAFFDAAGNLVTVLSMEPCVEDPCPTYSPGAEYRFALEAPPGRLGALAEGTVLEVVGDL